MSDFTTMAYALLVFIRQFVSAYVLLARSTSIHGSIINLGNWDGSYTSQYILILFGFFCIGASTVAIKSVQGSNDLLSCQ